MLPDGNNCYGRFLARPDCVVQALEELGDVALRSSGYDGSLSVRFRAEVLELESEPLPDGDHLFNGVVDLEAGGLALLALISVRLAACAIVHSFEVNDARDGAIAYLHHGCPRPD
jgi:hypothetical protein